METRTFHVYPSESGWIVKKESKRPQTFATQREAIAAATRIAKNTAAGQVVIHNKDGKIIGHHAYHMIPIQDPPKGSRSASRIRDAVGKVALRRVKKSTTSRERTPKT